MAINKLIHKGLCLWLNKWRFTFGYEINFPSEETSDWEKHPELFSEMILKNLDDSVIQNDNDIDDVHTADLQLLLKPFLIALGLSNANVNAHATEARIGQLERALKQLDIFHSRLRKLIYRDEDPVSIEQQAREYLKRNDRASAIRLREERKRLANLIIIPPDLFKDDLASHHDEEIRDFWIALLNLALLEACVLFKSCSSELELQTMTHTRPSKKQNDENASLKINQKIDGPSHIGIIHIPDKAALRARMQEEVFRVPYNLPTMSLDEIVAKEYHQDVEILQAAQKRSQTKYERRSGGDSGDAYDTSDSDRGEVFEKPLDELRAWDDWKDENPRGSGNKMVNRG